MSSVCPGLSAVRRTWYVRGTMVLVIYAKTTGRTGILIHGYFTDYTFFNSVSVKVGATRV